jgi:hypothetical protein
MYKVLLSFILILTACTSTVPIVYKPTDTSYILIQVRDKGHQRFDYIIDPEYEVRVVSDNVEIWHNNIKMDTIYSVSNITWGPKE